LTKRASQRCQLARSGGLRTPGRCPGWSNSCHRASRWTLQHLLRRHGLQRVH
jgi:hypothetical protein